MDESTEKEGLKYLEKIEEEVSELERKSPGVRRAFIYGIMQGFGIVIGSVLGVLALGWVLSLMGLVPGLQDFADKLREISASI